MKKLFSLSIMLMLAISTMFAQDVAKEAKSLTKAISAAGDDADKLKALEGRLMTLFENPAAMKNVMALIAKGNYYSGLASTDFAAFTLQSQLGQEIDLNHVGSASKAFDAFKAAVPLAEKSSQTKTIFDKLAFLHNYFITDLNDAIGKENWEIVMDASKGAIAVSDFLVSQGKEASLPDESIADLKNKAVYSASQLVSQYFESGDEAKANMLLEEAKSIDPDNVQILFAEINVLLKKGDNAKLETLLKKAIEKEPDNPSIYLILGNVYREQFEKKMEAGMKAEADSAFDTGVEYYTKSNEVDNTYSLGLYSIGEMWYNKAAYTSQDLEKLASDYSKEGLAKSEALQNEMKTYFKNALPFFKNAEKVDPNNKNNLILLKEALVRIDDFEGSSKVKARIEAIEAGEKFESSLFE